MHLPLRLLETGSIDVKVLFIFASQVFFLLTGIIADFLNNVAKIYISINMPQSCKEISRI